MLHWKKGDRLLFNMSKLKILGDTGDSGELIPKITTENIFQEKVFLMRNFLYLLQISCRKKFCSVHSRSNK